MRGRGCEHLLRALFGWRGWFGVPSACRVPSPRRVPPAAGRRRHGTALSHAAARGASSAIMFVDEYAIHAIISQLVLLPN